MTSHQPKNTPESFGSQIWLIRSSELITENNDKNRSKSHPGTIGTALKTRKPFLWFPQWVLVKVMKCNQNGGVGNSGKGVHKRLKGDSERNRIKQAE